MSGEPYIYRFDGIRWRKETIPGATVPFTAVDPTDVIGFGPNDAIVVGAELGIQNDSSIDKAYVARFDGSSWIRATGIGGRWLFSVSMSSSADIWASGWDNLLRWDGNAWKNQSPDFYRSLQYSSLTISRAGEVWMVGYWLDSQPNDTNVYYLWRRRASTWAVVDSEVQTVNNLFQDFPHQIKSVDDRLFGADAGVVELKNGNWSRMFYDSDVVRIGGSGVNHLYAVGSGGKAYHFNGIDWHPFTELLNPDAVLLGVWTDGNEVFIAGFLEGGLRGIVWHGR